MAQPSGNAILLPVFCRGPVILRALVLAQAVAIVLAFAPHLTEDPWVRLGFVSLFVQWIMLITVALLCVMRGLINRLAALKQGIVVMLILLGVCALVSIVAHTLLTNSLWTNAQPLSLFLIKNVLVAFIVGLISIQFFMLHTERNQRVAAQSRAELDALQARIQPHFLFNSLNTIAELTQQDANLAEQALLDLSGLIRAALYAGGNNSLTEEIDLAKHYLALEQLRLGTRLQVVWTLPEQIPNLVIPALTIQPLIENAVRHGIEPEIQGGVIEILLQLSKGAATFIITNAVPAVSQKTSGNGIALENIRQRLALQFDDKARLVTAVLDGKFRVKLVLPMSKSDGEPS